MQWKLPFPSLLAAGALAFVPLAAAGAPPGTPSRAGVGAAERADIVRLINMTGALDVGIRLGDAIEKQMIANVEASNPSVSDAALRDIREGVMEVLTRPSTKQKFLDAAVGVYARHFTDEDIRGMIRFYQTPLGRKVIRTLPAVTREGVLAGEAVIRPLRPELIQTIKEKLERDHIDPRTLQPETR